MDAPDRPTVPRAMPTMSPQRSSSAHRWRSAVLALALLASTVAGPASATPDALEHRDATIALQEALARLDAVNHALADGRGGISRARRALEAQSEVLVSLREDQDRAIQAFLAVVALRSTSGSIPAASSLQIADEPVRSAVAQALLRPDPVASAAEGAADAIDRVDLQLDLYRTLAWEIHLLRQERRDLRVSQRRLLRRIAELRTQVSLTAPIFGTTPVEPEPAPVGQGDRAVGPGPFAVCPVDEPRVIADDFGAPRYSGGYHPHAGNDILAPRGTPIRATFAGKAVVASNTLGGLSVKVYGKEGYTYNAHLQRLGKLGRVRAGDIIGYVGNSGNAAGGPTHNHFEWHPYRPGNVRTINGAVDPNPALLAACG